MRILKRLALGLLGLVAAALIGLYISDPVFTTRLVGLAFGGDLGPRATVKGGALIEIPVTSEAQRKIPKEALDAAIAYGAEMESHALLVYRDGGIELEYYYPGHSRDSITATQSMHKSVLALLVGLAIRDGYIQSVDDPAAKYVQEWAADDRKNITIRQMLQQSSGIDFPGFAGFAKLTLGGDIGPLALERKAVDPPGSRFDYNGINPEVLGILLQRVTGRSYADYLSDALWQHLGVPDAAVVLDSDDHRIPRTFCCLDATARSWLAVGLLHLNQGRVGDQQVVPAEWMKAVITPAPTNPNYGYFTWLGSTFEKERRYNSKSAATAWHSEAFASPDVIYFDGFGGQRVYIVPSKQLVIVHTGPLKPDWDDAKLPNLIIRSLP